MRTNILNKAVNTVKADKTDKAPAVIRNIRERSDAINAAYERRKAELENELADNQKELEAGKAALDAADNVDDYDIANEAVRRAELKIRFANNALRKYVEAPRMSGEEYDELLKACRTTMEDAATGYRTKALELIDQLRNLRSSYLSLAADINGALEGLDAAANVMQTRYPCRVTTYVQDATSTYDVRTPDPNEWKNHALRYTPDAACKLANDSGDQDGVILGRMWTVLSGERLRY